MRKLAEPFLFAVGETLKGPRAARERFLAELRDHLDDAIADEVAIGRAPVDAECAALVRLGTEAEIAASWQSYAARRRRETRRRVAALTLAAATASALAVAQHASGIRQPAASCATSGTIHAAHTRQVQCAGDAK